MMGFFPDRVPSAAAALIPLHASSLATVVQVVTTDIEATALLSVDLQDQRIQDLAEAVGGLSAAVGCDSLGRVGISAEFGFGDRVPAMIDRRWDAILSRVDLGASSEAIPYLLSTQTIHDFRDLFPLTVLSGIDHLKFTPDGRVKAYVGALPFQRGVGINGLPPGMV